MGMPKWTDKQQQVIDTRNKSILVSAAAGSGKTAVLVERIIKKVTDKTNPVDIDKILVVTFTNAAATEMRERVLKALTEELKKDPLNEHLERQQTFIHNAHITTIHSFCLNLIREHFNETDLDPAVRVADDNEIKLLKSDVVKDVLEEYYTEHDDKFIEFVNQFESKNTDEYLEKIILDLYDTAMGYPEPLKWLDKCVADYEYEDAKALGNSKYLDIINKYSDGILKDSINKYQEMIDICLNGGPYTYAEQFREEMSSIESIYNESDYDRRRVKLNMSFDRLPQCKKDSCDETLKKKVTSDRDNIKSVITKLRQGMYANSLEESFDVINKCKEVIETYISVTKSFMDKFSEKKHEKNIIDFNDFEHYAISLLVEDKEEKLVPTKVADELAKEFDEIMVDEYQDSNLVQEVILKSLSKERFGIHNRFMVGDVKQSIYGFRGANPDLFVEKYNTYSEDTSSDNIKIILDRNFRSRRGVLDTTNFVFDQIMGKDFGGIDYTKEELVYGAGYANPPEEYSQRVNDETGLLLIDSKQKAGEDSDNEDSSEEIQAKVIAKKINELMDRNNGMAVFDKDENKYRPLRYSDIAILARSFKKTTDAIYEELNNQNIPVAMESKTGYFKTVEIRTLISFLKIIDNPLQDIPLMIVIKSDIYGIEDTDIAKIRALGGKDKPLYQNIREYISYNESDDENKEMPEGLEYDEKLRISLCKFRDDLDDMRDKSVFMTIYELLDYVINKTDYINIASAMTSGRRRTANIMMLKTRASEYEKGSYKGLFNFIRYIEKMNKYKVEMGEASIASDSFDAVRIMTIHKSKGLEFPVVFVININGEFNKSDANSKCVIHSKMGIGMDYINMDTRICSKNIIKQAIIKQIQLDIIQEEMRIFYVACTRAKDRLFLTAVKVDDGKLDKLTADRNNDNLYLGYGTVSRFGSYLDFIARPLARNKAFDGIYREILSIDPPVGNIVYDRDSNVNAEIVKLDDIFLNMIEDEYDEKLRGVALINIDENHIYSEEVKERITNLTDYKYQYEKESETIAKISVSDIKKISTDTNMESEKLDFSFLESGIEEITDDIKKDNVVATNRGNAYHKIFEKFDYSIEPNKENIELMIDGFVNSGFITTEEKDEININDFVKFGKTNLYIKMKKAYENDRLYREQQFVAGFYETEIDFYKQWAKNIGEGNHKVPEEVEKHGDTVLIQGIIDAYYIEDGRVYIVDYKTDNVKEDNTLTDRYYIQLKLYEDAISRILDIPSGGKIIYSTRMSKEIIL